jgi:hypothetical protein
MRTIVIVLLVLVGLVPPAQAETSGPGSGGVLVLLDRTDPWSPVQLQQIREHVLGLAGDLRPGESMWVFVLAGHSPRLVLHVASPGRGRDANRWFEGARHRERRFEREVLQPVDSLLSTLPEADSSGTSPVLEALWQTTTMTDFARVGGPKKLVLATDLIENGATFSFYKDVSFFGPDGKLRDPSWQASFSGVSVEVLWLLRARDEARQTPSLLEEFERYVTSCGGEPPVITAVAS